MSKIEVVLWDLDSTLLDQTIPQRVTIKKCFEIYGWTISEEQLDLFPSINNKYWAKLDSGEMTKEELTAGRFAEFLEVCGKDGTVAKEFNHLYMSKHGETVCFCPNALETLQTLHGKVRQYVATNGLVIAQQGKIDHSGIGKLIDGAFISETIGFDKPAPEFYDIVLNKIGIHDRRSVMMVGDALNTDMQGGVNAGIVTCWYNPSHAVNNWNLPIDYEINDLAEVVNAVLML